MSVSPLHSVLEVYRLFARLRKACTRLDTPLKWAGALKTTVLQLVSLRGAVIGVARAPLFVPLNNRGGTALGICPMIILVLLIPSVFLVIVCVTALTRLHTEQQSIRIPVTLNYLLRHSHLAVTCHYPPKDKMLPLERKPYNYPPDPQ